MALVDADALMEEARAVKCPDEITAMRCAVHAWEAAVGEMRAAFEPGATEMALWSVLQAGNLARYGEWIETRLLASGPAPTRGTRRPAARSVSLTTSRARLAGIQEATGKPLCSLVLATAVAATKSARLSGGR